MPFVTKVPIHGNEYWQVRHSYRRHGGPNNYYIEQLGPVGSEERGTCSKCGNEKILYPDYNMCEDCITSLPHIKEKVEEKR